MFDHPLSLAARGSVTITALVFVLVGFRAIFGALLLALAAIAHRFRARRERSMCNSV